MRTLTGIEFKQLAYENEVSLRSISKRSEVSETFIYAWTAGSYKFDIKPKTYDKIVAAYRELKKER